MLIDSHAHINDRQFAHDLPETLARAASAGIDYIVNVGYDLPSSRASIALARQHANVFAAVGIHPHDAKKVTEQTYVTLRDLARYEKVVAVGEMGLDYYRDLSPRPQQMEVFRTQIALARELGLPIIVHDRDAHGDTVAVLKDGRAGEVGGVLHCFAGSWQMARECLDMGFYLSLAGPLTYKNAYKPQEIARLVPLDRLLIETDAPYLSPEPNRGRRNEPAFVRLVAEQIAMVRRIPLEQVAAVTSANARRLFRMPDRCESAPLKEARPAVTVSGMVDR